MHIQYQIKTKQKHNTSVFEIFKVQQDLGWNCFYLKLRNLRFRNEFEIRSNWCSNGRVAQK